MATLVSKMMDWVLLLAMMWIAAWVWWLCAAVVWWIWNAAMTEEHSEYEMEKKS